MAGMEKQSFQFCTDIVSINLLLNENLIYKRQIYEKKYYRHTFICICVCICHNMLVVSSPFRALKELRKRAHSPTRNRF